MFLFCVRHSHSGSPRIVAATITAAALLMFSGQPADAQWFGWEKPNYKPRHAHPARFRSERRTANTEASSAKKNAEAPAPKKKVEVPELPQMAFAVVSLADQRISIYGAEGLLTRSVVSTGQPGHRTPTGIFTILEKQRWHESNIYSGAPMPFMQRVTWSGVAMHEGIVPGYPASHGCIRLPAAFAAKLWTMTKPGTRVIIAAHDLQPFEFAHALLPVPKMVPALEFALDHQPVAARVTLASNDPESAGSTSLIAAAGETASDVPRLMNPLEVAYAMKAKAAAEAIPARKAVDTSLAAARAASQDADAAGSELRAAKLELDRARAKLDAARNAAEAERANSNKPASEAGTVSNADAPPAPAATASSDVALAEDAVKFAEARLAAAKSDEDIKSSRAFELASAARAAEKAVETASDAATDARRRQLPVNVVVSRKEGMILVRQGFKAVYEAPVTIAQPEKPLGTHIMVAIEASGDMSGLDWAAITVPTSGDEDDRKAKSSRKGRGEPVAEAPRLEPSGIEEALERITMPESAKQRIAELIWVGGSVVITDRGLSNESGEHTDLNVSLP